MDKNNLKIVFLGTPEFAVASLDALFTNGYNIKAVVTTPDKPAGRGKHMQQSAVKEYAIEKGIAVLQPEKLKDPEFLERLRLIDADLFIVIAFRMLPQEVWAMPRLGTFNLHASLLPKYRGAAPINRAVMNGDSETGVTTFFLKHEIDTGDIIDREKIEIGEDENVGSVHDRLMQLGAELTLKTTDAIISGTLKTVSQDSLVNKGQVATPAPKIFKETCRINWNKPASEIHNFVRGLSPYPGAWTVIEDNGQTPVEMKIFETAKTTHQLNTAIAPGTVVVDKTKMFVACGQNTTIEIKSLRPAGRKQMDAASYLRGARLTNAKMSN